MCSTARRWALSWIKDGGETGSGALEPDVSETGL